MRRLISCLVWALVVSGCVQRSTEGKIPVAYHHIFLGLEYDIAVDKLRRSGATEFVSGYRKASTKRNFVYGWYTLANGMTLAIEGSSKDESRTAVIDSLAVCNSTTLFCSKGETWYEISEIKFDRDYVELRGLQGSFIHIGMSSEGLEDSSKRLVISSQMLKRLPQGGDWLRLGVSSEVELLIQIENGRVSRLVFDAGAPADPPQIPEHIRQAARRFLIECQLLNLDQPLKTGWSGALMDEQQWDPSNPDKSRLSNKSGHRR
jgi:hypothetical protein